MGSLGEVKLIEIKELGIQSIFTLLKMEIILSDISIRNCYMESQKVFVCPEHELAYGVCMRILGWESEV